MNKKHVVKVQIEKLCIIEIVYSSTVHSQETFNTETKITFNNFNQLHF